MSIRKQTAIWTTKSGERIRICDMTDTHLINTIQYLLRTAEKKLHACICAAYSVGSSFNPDSEAAWLCDQDLDLMESMSAEDYLERETPLWEKLTNEALRRGIDYAR